MHVFSRKQPDLNWENPTLRAEIYKMMHFWLRKGIDGFRLDAINMISKVPGLPDAPVTTNTRYQFGGEYFINGPRLSEFLTEMKREALAHYDVFSVGETPKVTTEHGIALTNQESGPLSMLFQFEHMEIDTDPASDSPKWSTTPWRLNDLKATTSRWQTELAGTGWNSVYLSNHDTPRTVSRFGDDGRYRVESAKLLATFLHMLQGTPYIYQGEEIGMTNVAFDTIDDYRDVDARNMYREFVNDRGMNPRDVLEMIHSKGRDNARTPMQWDASDNAGFSTGTPWIKVNPNYTSINVAEDRASPDSIFAYYQQLIRLRKDHPVIVYGTYQLLLPDDPELYVFTRTLDSERLLVILNFSANTPVFHLPDDVTTENPELLIANYPVDANQPIAGLTLRPYEARVYSLGSGV